MNGALKAAWGLTVFVIVLGIVLWATTGSPVFAIFIVLGVLTGTGAAFAFRTAPATGRRTPPSTEEPS